MLIMRYDSEHKERTRQRVLSEAAMAIRAAGPTGIGVADIMKRAGLTHGGFYAHFESKDDLVAQAITFMFDDAYERLYIATTADTDPAKALIHYIDRYLSVRHRDAPQKGCPLPSLSGDLPRLPTEARERFNAGLGRLTRSLAGLIKSIGRKDADQLAASALAEMVGALALSRAVPDSAASEHLLTTSRQAVKARLGLA